MHEVRIGEKGQITLPKTIRTTYQLEKGDQVSLVDLGNGIMEVVLLKHSSELPAPVIRPGRKVSVSEMKEVTRRAAVGRVSGRKGKH